MAEEVAYTIDSHTLDYVVIVLRDVDTLEETEIHVPRNDIAGLDLGIDYDDLGLKAQAKLRDLRSGKIKDGKIGKEMLTKLRKRPERERGE